MTEYLYVYVFQQELIVAFLAIIAFCELFSLFVRIKNLVIK